MKYTHRNLKEKSLIGYMGGIIGAISWRKDIPRDVRETCGKAYKKYEEFYDKKEVNNVY